MKQLKTVFAFEFTGYLKRRAYIILTVILMVAVAVVLCLPRFASDEGGESSDADPTTVNSESAAAGEEDVTVVPVLALDDSYTAEDFNALGEDGVRFEAYTGDEEALAKAVESGEYDDGVVLLGPLNYQRIVRSVSMYDSFEDAFGGLLLRLYRGDVLEEAGFPAETVDEFLDAEVQTEYVVLGEGKDQMQNFIYSYVLIFVLYFAIIMYGQFVASSVATEKSTRAMELLITSTRPNSLMFGKVLGAGFAGLLQLALIFGTAFLFYNLNISYYTDNFIVQSIFGIQLSNLLFMLLFFILGFFIYAFIFAALASLVSRMEDLSTATMPVTFIFIAAFMIVMFSMASGQVDTPLMIFCSYFPLTSPMAMFVRISMGSPAEWEVLISVIILVASTIGIGMLSAAIYRLGVLLYGNPPKPAEIARMLRNARN